jgi:hypothetical protein
MRLRIEIDIPDEQLRELFRRMNSRSPGRDPGPIVQSCASTPASYHADRGVIA